MASDPNSHVVMRRLTTPWEFDDGKEQRQLHYYDFRTNEFDTQSSRHLLTSVDSFGSDLETFLNKTVESDLARHLNDLDAGQWNGNLPWRQRRALILSTMFQPFRFIAGRGEQEGIDQLRFWMAQEQSYFDNLAVGATASFHFMGVRLPPGQYLFFPSDGLQVLPLLGSEAKAPGMFVQPTGLDTICAAVPAGVPEERAASQIRAALDLGFFPMISVGLQCDRVVIPPPFIRCDKNDLRGMILAAREAARNLTIAVAAENRKLGYWPG